MDGSLVVALMIATGVVVALFLIGFLYELGKRAYYWTAAKIYGWSPREQFTRETAWLDRETRQEELLVRRDAIAASDRQRRRYGVMLLTIAILALAVQVLPMWQTMLVAVVVYSGATMAAGLAWKWW